MKKEDLTLTIKTLQEMTASMLRIYPTLQGHIRDFQTLVIQKFTDNDIQGLKDVILKALDTMRKADIKELVEGSGIPSLQNIKAQKELQHILGIVHFQITAINALESGLRKFKAFPSNELAEQINRLNTKLKDLLQEEMSGLERLAIESDKAA